MISKANPVGLLFDPFDEADKSPFGSLREGETARWHVRVPRVQAAFSMFLALAEDGQGPRMVPMQWLGLSDGYDGYACELAGLAPGLYWYWFIQDVFGDRTAFGDRAPWQLTVYRRGYDAPAWFDGGVTYHIFVDRFCRAGGPPKAKEGRNFKLHGDWYEAPDLYPQGQLEQNYDFFGGNLDGIREKLDYLESLGVTTIYLSPIFESASNHRYDTGDYRSVDPIAGDEQSFRALCADTAARGMAVILDGVFNHTGSDSVYFNAKGLYPGVGAAQSPDSPYSGWYCFRRWPDEYDCWWGVKTLPQVNESDPGFLEFTLEGEDSVVKHWLRAGAAGYRLDVADELPQEYLEKLRAAVKSVKPDAVLIGEVWEDASTKVSYGRRRRYLQGRELDGVTNYPARNAILDFAAGRLPAQGLAAALLALHEHYPEPARRCMMNILGTHDTPRTINVLGCAPEAFSLSKEEKAAYAMPPEEREKGRRLLMLAAAIQYMLPGSPCLYYGDEAGLTGFEDPLNRRGFPWGREDGALLDWYRMLGRMRREFRSAFADGQLRIEAAGEDVVTVTRTDGVTAVTAWINRGLAAYPVDAAAAGRPIVGALPMEHGCPTVPPQSAVVCVKERQ